LINHSCDPNCGILLRRGVECLEIHAIKPISSGEELATDYASFESEILYMPGPCLCGSTLCRGRITGYWELPPHRKTALGVYVAEYLIEAEALIKQTA
jgi:hypothetical protein